MFSRFLTRFSYPAPRLLLTATLLLPATAHGQLSIDRGELELKATGDMQARSGVLVVRNTTDARLQGQVTLEDWDRAPDGANRFHKSGTLPHSCGESLRVFPMALTLAPGESQSLRIDYTGGDRTAECTALIVVEESRSAAGRAAGVSVNMRMGLKVYVMPASGIAGGEVTDVVVTAAASVVDSSVVTVTYRNDGNRHVQAKGRLEVRRDDNSVVTSLPLPTVYALGGAVMQTKATLPTLPIGKYILLAIYDYGGSDLAAAQLEYEVTR